MKVAFGWWLLCIAGLGTGRIRHGSAWVDLLVNAKKKKQKGYRTGFTVFMG